MGTGVGVCSNERGVWSVESGAWSVECGVWSVEGGTRSVEGGTRKSIYYAEGVLTCQKRPEKREKELQSIKPKVG